MLTKCEKIYSELQKRHEIGKEIEDLAILLTTSMYAFEDLDVKPIILQRGWNFENPSYDDQESFIQRKDQLMKKIKELDEFDIRFWNDYLSHIDSGIRQDLWMLCVDQKDIVAGPGAYDQGTNVFGIAEIGYLFAAETGMFFMLATLNEPFNVSYLQMLHSLLIFNVRRNMITSFAITEGQLAPSSLATGMLHLIKPNTTKMGLAELATFDDIKVYFIDKNQNKIYLDENNSEQFFNVLQEDNMLHVDPVEVNEIIVNRFIKEYHQRIAIDNKPQFAIAELLRKLDTLHCFSDGNIRLCRTLMYKLLLENNRSLSLLPDPNCIDGYSSQEVATLIENGAKLFNSRHEFFQQGIKNRLSEMNEKIPLLTFSDTELKAPRLGEYDYRKFYHAVQKFRNQYNEFRDRYEDVSKQLDSLGSMTSDEVMDYEKQLFCCQIDMKSLSVLSNWIKSSPFYEHSGLAIESDTSLSKKFR